MTPTITTLKPEQLQKLLRNSTPGPWSAFHKSKYDEWHVSVPLEDGSGMTLGLFPDGIETNHCEADARLIALAPELAQGYLVLQAAVATLLTVDAEHRAWLEVTPPWLRDEGQGGFTARFHSAYSALAARVQPSAAFADAGALGGAGEVSRNDTPERLPYQHDLIGQDGDAYASIEVEADPAGHPLPLGLTLHRAVLLEAYGDDEADVTLPLTFDEAQALGERLVEGAQAGRGQ